MADAALVAAIRTILADSPFYGDGHRKVWARLRLAAVRTSKRRVLRLMREHGLLAPSRVGSPRSPRNHAGTIILATIGTMWGTDPTTVRTAEGQAALQRAYASCAHGHAAVIAVDRCSAECVGIHRPQRGRSVPAGTARDGRRRAARRATRFEALEPIRQGVRHHFGGFAPSIAVRHDHGSQYLAHHFQLELAFLGFESSPAFVRAPEGNGCAERFIRTVKENLLWVRTLATTEELRLALLALRETYNASWLIERHGFKPSAAFRHEQLQPAALAA